MRNKSFVTCVLVFVVTKLSIVYSLPPYVAPAFYFVIFSSLFFLFSLPFVLLHLHKYVALLLANFDNLCPCSPSVPFFCSSFTSIVLIFLPCSPLVPSSGSFHLPSCDYFSLMYMARQDPRRTRKERRTERGTEISEKNEEGRGTRKKD